MAGELSNQMLSAAAQAIALNARALHYVADAFATEEERDFQSVPLQDMLNTFNAHGHGDDLRYCNDPFCTQARQTIRNMVGQEMQKQEQEFFGAQGGGV